MVIWVYFKGIIVETKVGEEAKLCLTKDLHNAREIIINVQNIKSKNKKIKENMDLVGDCLKAATLHPNHDCYLFFIPKAVSSDPMVFACVRNKYGNPAHNMNL